MKQTAFFVGDDVVVYKKPVRHRTASKKSFNCSTCGLDTKCNSPRMERFGEGRKGILIVGQGPGLDEDIEGRPFVGVSGKLLRRVMAGLGLDLDKDCVITNVVRCRPTEEVVVRGKKTVKNRAPTVAEMKCCRRLLMEDVKAVKPKLIICLGDEAINSFLKIGELGVLKPSVVHGLTFPSHEYGCWVGACYHPSYIVRSGDFEHIFRDGLSNILSYLSKPVPPVLSRDGCDLISDSNEAMEILKQLVLTKEPVAFDYETNCISSYDKGAEILSVALSFNEELGCSIPLSSFNGDINWNDVEFAHVKNEWIKFLKSGLPKVVQNYNMEELWSRTIFGCSVNNVIWDTMVSHHVVYCRRKTTSLDFQAYLYRGDDYGGMVDKKKMVDEPWEKVGIYGALDARYTFLAYQEQKKFLQGRNKEKLSRFNGFLTKSLNVLANLKERGLRVDMGFLHELREGAKGRIITFEKDIIRKSSEKGSFLAKFKSKYGKVINVKSSSQMSELLYGVCGLSPIKRSMTRGSVSREALLGLRGVDDDIGRFIDDYLTYGKSFSMLKKVKEYERLVDPDGFLHPSYNLNVAETYRSSASGPNSQNIFKHDDDMAVFRKCIVPHEGYIFLEGDYDGLEVRIIAMVSGDKQLRREIVDGVDTHRLWASRLLGMSEEDVTSEQRFDVKGNFVFASFYGAESDSCAKKLNLCEGVVPKLSERYVREVQGNFWDAYSGVREWQQRILAFYSDHGYVEGVTGFRRYGALTREKVLNTPIQGPAFHLALKALRLIDEEMLHREMKSRAIVEIHDSILFNVCLDELEEVMEIAERNMVEEQFDWQQGIPLSVSWECGNNLYNMESV